jgi:predicted Zn-dependent peptidase
MNKTSYSYIGETVYSKKLDNGLTVFLFPKKEMSKTYSLFSTNYGSIDQTFIPAGQDEIVTVPEGIAHFLEHKMFEKEDRDVFADFGKQGASANAYTSFTRTAYLFSATNHIEENIQTLLDFVQDPYFSEASVEKEKGIIEQEIQMYDDQPNFQAFMGTIKSLFKNHPVNIDIAGTVDSIQKITKDDLYMCYHTFYHPENMTLVVAGNFDPEQMMALIEENQRQKNFPKLDEIVRKYPHEPEEVATKDKEMTMSVSIPKCTVGVKDSVSELTGEAFLKKEILTEMLLDYYYSKSGRFYEELYNENLIDDSFYASSSLEKSFGYTLIGSNTRKPEAFAARVKEQLLSAKEQVITEEDFDRMKKKQIGLLLRGMNSMEFIANNFIYYNQVGIDLFEVVPYIQSLQLEDMITFQNNWIAEDQLAVCTILPE